MKKLDAPTVANATIEALGGYSDYLVEHSIYVRETGTFEEPQPWAEFLLEYLEEEASASD